MKEIAEAVTKVIMVAVKEIAQVKSYEVKDFQPYLKWVYATLLVVSLLAPDSEPVTVATEAVSDVYSGLFDGGVE